MREWRQGWRDLFYAFRIALDLRKLVPALAGLFITGVVLYVLVLGRVSVAYAPVGGHAPRTLTLKQIIGDYGIRGPEIKEFGKAVVYRYLLGREYVVGVGAAGESIALSHYFRLAAALVILWLAWSLIIGVIARVAAVEVARDERIEFREAVRYSWQKKWSNFWSPTAPLVALCLFYLCVLLWGWVGGWTWGGSLGSALGVGIAIITSPLAAITALVLAFLFLGLVGGYHLMLPAVAAEGTDAFDAVSRSYSYVYSKPWHLLWYRLIGWGYGKVACVFVGFFTYLFLAFLLVPMLWGMQPSKTEEGMTAGRGEQIVRFLKLDTLSQVINRKFQAGIDYPVRLFSTEVSPAYKVSVDFFNKHDVVTLDEQARWAARATRVPCRSSWSDAPANLKMSFATSCLAWVVGFFVVFFIGLAAAFPVSYVVSSATIQYFLLRRRVDGVEFKEVYLEEPEEDYLAGVEDLGMTPVDPES